ncbi:MAG TPA: amidohydrolase, partial [Flavobacterium sp.]|nr:amidohydrolase [Flavobacterium sp.]
RVNTFTHILEGYKVADKMKEHGVGASTFSDWWAYKFEVNDAIPFNGPIMHNAGIVVAYNSDDAEMSRRLNQEAAKAVKYGNVSEEDAWKFVTL